MFMGPQEATRAKEVEERDKRTALLLSGAADVVATISAATPPGTPPQPSLARKVRCATCQCHVELVSCWAMTASLSQPRGGRPAVEMQEQ